MTVDAIGEQSVRSSAESHDDGARRRHGAAWQRRVRGLHVLRLAGDDYEMGVQHGTLLRDEVARGPIPYFRGYVEKLMGTSPLGPLVWPALQLAVGRRVERKLPRHAVDMVRGIADGAGLSARELLDGCTMPDSMLWLASRLMQVKGVGPAVHHRMALGLGCTSAVAWGAATRDGKLLHARNFDYHGVGCWPESAAVQFYSPRDGQKYASVAAAGVALGGITAMNESGLSLTVHQHMFTDAARLGGTPVGIAGDAVMRHARSLDDAERIFGEYRPIGCWTYVVTDGRRREVLCWEENPERHVAHRKGEREGEDTFGYANIYLDPELGARESNLYGSYWRHNQGRFERARALLAERRGALDPQAMAGILADRGDPRCRIRDSIAMVMTVASVVFRPEDGVFWVGTGEAPTSRGAYIPFDVHAQDHAPAHGELRVEDDETPAAREGFERFRRAFVSYMDHGDVGGARAEVEQARAVCPDQAVYHALAGLLALAQGDGASSRAAFDSALALGHPDEARRASFHLWRARAKDLTGERRAAVADYRAVLGHNADEPVKRAARKGLDRAFTRAKAQRVHIDFSLADVVGP